jgi:hypothetical protein
METLFSEREFYEMYPAILISFLSFKSSRKMVTEPRKALRIEPFVNPPENLKNLLSINRRFCVECGNVPTQIAYFDVGESILTERYCDNCIKTVNIG